MSDDTSLEDHVEYENNKSKFRINKKLVMLKLTLFFLYGANSSLTPYLTVHMQSVGLTIEEIGIIYLALPFTTFLAPPITGFLVDKFGKYKLVVIVSFVLTAVLHHSLLMIPHQEMPGTVPPGFVLTHPRKGYVEVWWSPCPSRECPEEEELDVILDMCVDHCLLRKNRRNKFLRNDTSNTAIDVGNDDDLILHLTTRKNTTKNANSSSLAQFTVDMHDNLGDPIELFGMDVELDEDDDVMDFRKRFNERLLKRFGVNVTELDESDLRCGGILQSAKNNSSDLLLDFSTDCILQKCNFRSGGPKKCPPGYKESSDTIFWIYFILRFIGNIMMTAGVTIMDPIALSMVEKFGGDFGKEKLFSSLGMALFSPITGAFIDFSTSRLGYTDYSAAFYTYDILMIISAITVFLLPLESKLPADNIFGELMKIFQVPAILVFVMFLFILGNFWGFIESYLFFYLRDLGASNYLLGITVTVGTMSSLPFLYGAEEITKRIGHVNIIVIAFFAHAGRLLGYSIIQNAWWCFPFESLESLSVHLMWVAAATYGALLAPPHLLATLIGVLGMTHFSIGRGSGSFIGGYIISKSGIRQAFKLMGTLAFVSGVAYGLIHYIYLQKKTKKRKEIYLGEQYSLKDEEPKFKDQATMVTFDRLSLMIEYNQIGSLTSLYRSRSDQSRIMRARSNSIKRDSFSDVYRSSRGSTSKSELLKSTAMDSKNPMRNLNGSLVHQNANSSGKLNSESKVPSLSRLAQRSFSLTPNDRYTAIISRKDEAEHTGVNNVKRSTNSQIEDSEYIHFDSLCRDGREGSIDTCENDSEVTKGVKEES